MSIRSFGFAEYKEAEAWAHRIAREKLTGPQEALLASAEFEDMGEEFQDKLFGLASQMHLDRIVTQFATGWTGVLDDLTGEPLNLTPDTWESFRSQQPILADIFLQKITQPFNMIAAEGNVSAPLPNTGQPEA